MGRILKWAACVAVGGALLTACGSKEASDAVLAGPGGTEAPASTAPASGGSTVAPAAGDTLEIEGISVRAPVGWTRYKLVVDVPNTVLYRSPDTLDAVSVTSPQVFVGDGATYDDLVDDMREEGFEVMDPVELDGQPFARGQRLEGRRGDREWHVRHVTMHQGYGVGLSFWFPPSTAPEVREEKMAPVLATVELQEEPRS